MVEYSTPQRARQNFAVNVGDIGSEHQRGFFLASHALQNLGLANCELNGVGCGFDKYSNGVIEILDTLQKRASLKNP
jgi:hypothetical protein